MTNFWHDTYHLRSLLRHVPPVLLRIFLHLDLYIICHLISTNQRQRYFTVKLLIKAITIRSCQAHIRAVCLKYVVGYDVLCVTCFSVVLDVSDIHFVICNVCIISFCVVLSIHADVPSFCVFCDLYSVKYIQVIKVAVHILKTLIVIRASHGHYIFRVTAFQIQSLIFQFHTFNLPFCKLTALLWHLRESRVVMHQINPGKTDTQTSTTDFRRFVKWMSKVNSL